MRCLVALGSLVLLLGLAGTAREAARVETPASHQIVLVGAPGGRAVGGPAAEPLFLGGWWKTFKKIAHAFFNFIDAIIDATLPGDGGEGEDDVAALGARPGTIPPRGLTPHPV